MSYLVDTDWIIDGLSGRAEALTFLEARRDDYARAEAELDTSNDTVDESFAKLRKIASRYGKGRRP